MGGFYIALFECVFLLPSNTLTSTEGWSAFRSEIISSPGYHSLNEPVIGRVATKALGYIPQEIIGLGQ